MIKNAFSIIHYRDFNLYNILYNTVLWPYGIQIARLGVRHILCYRRLKPRKTFKADYLNIQFTTYNFYNTDIRTYLL